MELFNFPYHLLEVGYPESSAAVQFGRGYEFTSAPKGPDQIEWILHFDAMVFFQNVNGTYNLVPRPTLNMAVLENFYNVHKLHKHFLYPHPALGNTEVRFAEPLKYKILKGGKGAVEPFTLKLKTQP